MPFALSSRYGKLFVWLAGVLLLTVVYFCAAKMGLLVSAAVELDAKVEGGAVAGLPPVPSISKQVSAVWPATGIALAALLLFGIRYWPAITLGALLANLTVDEPFLVACGVATGNTLEAVIGAWLLRHVGFAPALERVRDVLSLVLLAGLLSTMVSATIGVASLCLGGVQSWERFEALWAGWWLGDAMGNLVFAPFLLTWATALRRPLAGRTEGLLLVASLLSVGGLIFVGNWTSGHGAYSAFPFVVWAALRFEQRGTTMVTFMVSGLAIAGALLAGGPFVEERLGDRLLHVQLFMGVVAITGLLLGAALAERREAESSKARAEAKFRFLAEASASLATLVDHESTLQSVARLSIDDFADWCIVDTVEAEGVLRRVVIAHRDPRRVQQLEDLLRQFPDTEDRGHGPRHVLRTGQPELLSDMGESALRSVAQSDEHFRLLAELGLKSSICVPLVLRGKMFGIITFAIAESDRRYDPDDLKLAQDLVHRAAVAIDNSKLYAELQQADRRKDEFLAMLAHELRNPLAPIRSGLDLLRMKGDDPETADWVHETMNQQVTHMVRLVDDLLDVSRIMRGKIQLRFEPVELKSIATRALEVARPLLDARRHEMFVRLPAEPIRVQADPVRLTQVVANLLNNAAKYTDEGGRIELTAEVVEAQLVIRVKDTGIGLTPEMQQHVFDLFAQADHSPERTQGGLGIGLTLVRSLVELHGGRVEAVSAGLGQGSEFIVRMPIMPWVEEAQAETESQPTASMPLRILVVDDNKAAATMVSRLLQAQGHTTQMTYDGLTAVDMVRQWRPDVVLLDIGLPGLSGYDVARQLRAQPEGEKLILIAVTGYGQQEDRQRSHEAGFDLHLVKPLLLDELKRAIVALRERAHAAAP